MAVKTSKLKALSDLSSWRLEAVDMFFGQIRPQPSRLTVLTGETVRDLDTGEVFIFQYRKNDNISLQILEETEEE